MSSKCKNCIYFKKAPSFVNKGYCRRYPPDHRSYWPLVHETDWCGDYKSEVLEEG